MKNLIPALAIVISSALIAGVIYLLGTKFLLQQAIDGCAHNAINTFTTQSSGQTNVITDINQSVYKQCLELKGVSTK